MHFDQLLNSLNDLNSIEGDNTSIYAKNYALGKDIDAQGNLAAIGYSGYLDTQAYAFTGQFDGMGHTISNADPLRGLFALIGRGGVVRDLNVTNASGHLGIRSADKEPPQGRFSRSRG
ncbi:hypothetical protein [Trinickia dinghuensis]|uniref:Uncharacterized protein n=1 Tax=Trinickia dinghuensis TaxID=2291023 RepID=A0A3D8K1Q8_9BURK|nr:hypothetical protein [Trinickia dinghuensis]RDU98992.1 hypothetical protein DWV00_12195 [Trinickia dinghuensis]